MITRRQFLTRLPLFAAAGALAACTRGGESAGSNDAWPITAREPLLPSPQPAAAPTPLPTPAPGTLGLAEFLQLSAVLTGFDDLDPTVGQVYLASLQSADSGTTPLALYQRAGFVSGVPPTSIDALASAGVYDDKALARLADTITEYWYSGMYGPKDSQQVATYLDALVWKAMPFTKPRTVCGPYDGFWRERPPVIAAVGAQP